MIGLADQLDVVEGLISALDVEKQDLRTLRVIDIQYVGAEEVVEKLAELGIISGERVKPTIPSRRTRPAAGQPPRPTAQQAAAGEEEEPLTEEPQVVIIESTNSLLINATDEQHAQIALVIGYVDTEAQRDSIPYVVYPLENQDPVDLATVLNELIMETVKGTQETKGDKLERTAQTRREEGVPIIVADPKTYSLIVYASKKDQQWISALIHELDEYRPQVLLDVTLVEITKNEEFTLDLDLVTKLPEFAAGGAMESGVEGVSALVSPFPGKEVKEASSLAGAGGKAFYADGHVQALFELMHRKGYGRVLARPKLLVNDNWEGTIKTEESVTVVSPKTDIIPGATGSPPTATTSVDLKPYEAGITLTITPHISKGDQLQLTIVLTRTDFRLRDDYAIEVGGQKLTGPTPPDLLTSDVQTVITVPDDTTIILGGLERIKQDKGGTKVPLLGDIPLVGALFRNVANTDIQSRLYVFVKAHIVRPGEELAGESDIQVVSRKNRATFEKYEEEMQEHEDWPGIKPKPMDPLRILETD